MVVWLLHKEGTETLDLSSMIEIFLELKLVVELAALLVVLLHEVLTSLSFSLRLWWGSVSGAGLLRVMCMWAYGAPEEDPRKQTNTHEVQPPHFD